MGCGRTGAALAAQGTPAARAESSSAPQTHPASVETSATPADKALVWDDKGGLALPNASNDRPSVLWQMLAAVLVILVLGGVGLLVIRKLLPRIAPRGGKRMAVLETIYLEPRKALHLVRVGEQKFLLAGSREGLTVLAEVTDAIGDEPDHQQPRPDGG
jgi:flagellar biogenesis protein FliO